MLTETVMQFASYPIAFFFGDYGDLLFQLLSPGQLALQIGGALFDS